ncbi:MAG: hypothetical protein IKA40_01795 [Clostridia bacterium]|nr:hypothetical protein [Clostridia bacterium]
MTQEKMRKIVTACVVAATTLLVVLLSVLIYQWISYAVLCGRVDKLKAENAQLQEVIDKNEKDLEYYESEAGLEVNAWLQGWVRP